MGWCHSEQADPQYLPNSPNMMFFSLLQFSLFLSGFHDKVFGYLGFLGRAWPCFCLDLFISGTGT